MSGEQVADALATLAQVADHRDIDACAVNLEYVRDNDKLLPGDMIPTITLSLKRHKSAVEPVPTNTSDLEPK